MRSMVAAVMPVLLAGCSATAPPAPPAPPSRSPGPAITVSPAGAVRGCADSASMNLPGGGPNSAAAGPARFTALDIRFGQPDPSVVPDALGWIPLKIALFVRPGARVTVSIPAQFRTSARLLYLPGGDAATTFESCAGAVETAFPGGVAITAPVCLPVDVGWDGQTTRLTLALLKAGC